MKAIINGRIMGRQGLIDGKALLFSESIRGIVSPSEVDGLETIDAQGRYVAPGLIDLHIHGYAGEDASDASEDGLRLMARRILENGVTSFLPTTMTMPWEGIEAALLVIRKLMQESREPGFDGAEIIGCHAEGPFLNPLRKGAQPGESIQAPDAQRLLPYQDVVRIATIAPEMPGGMELIRRLKRETSITLSIGHTDADFETTARAVDAGLSHATHLFNAMPPFTHRAPGAVGAVLSGDVSCELIADTFHVHPGLYPMLHRAKGAQLVLVSDSMRAAGLPDGEYSLGGQQVYVQGIQCRLEDGTIAGSVLRLNEAVRNYHRHGGMSLHAAHQAASLNAARAIGLDGRKGSLEPGKDADIILMDDSCAVSAAFVRGQLKYEA